MGTYSAILGFFVPSGGGKWIIEAPYVMQAANDLSAGERALYEEGRFDKSTITVKDDEGNVILDHEEGVPDRLAIVDYKTTKGHERDEMFAFQLAVYAAAGRSEGLDVRAAYLHHLEESERSAVPVDVGATTKAVHRVNGLVRELRGATFTPKPETKKCKACEYRRLCRHAPVDPWDDG